MGDSIISNKKINALKKRLESLNILESDISENFIKGSGPGGQKVNKTSSCVQLTHIPSGIEIKCQKTRSQSLNRYYARSLLCDEIEDRLIQNESKRQQEIQKIKRQKRKRSKRAKEKLLANKKIVSKIKILRKKVEKD